MLQKPLGCLSELRIVGVRQFDHLAEPFENSRKIRPELLNSLLELGNLSASLGKEQLQQSSHCRDIVNRAALDLAFVVDEKGLRGIPKDDVVLR